MRKIVQFYRTIGVISSTAAVAEAAIGWQLHGWIGVMVCLFFLGLSAAAFMIASHANTIDKKVRQGFTDHLDVVEPRLDTPETEDLCKFARQIRDETLKGDSLVRISHEIGALNARMIERGLLRSDPTIGAEV